jgi:hypothetical protein
MIARADLPYLKRSLLFLLLAMCASVSITLYSNIRLSQTQTAVHDAQHRLQQARHLAEATTNDNADVQRYLPAYTDLQTHGHIEDAHDNNEPSLERTLELERLREHHALPRFDYTLQPYRTLSSTSAGDDFEAGTQHAHLQFSLLHEGQLFAVLNELRESGFTVERCQIERGENLLHAECDGGRLSLRRRAAK